MIGCTLTFPCQNANSNSCHYVVQAEHYPHRIWLPNTTVAHAKVEVPAHWYSPGLTMIEPLCDIAEHQCFTTASWLTDIRPRMQFLVYKDSMETKSISLAKHIVVRFASNITASIVHGCNDESYMLQFVSHARAQCQILTIGPLGITFKYKPLDLDRDVKENAQWAPWIKS